MNGETAINDKGNGVIQIERHYGGGERSSVRMTRDDLAGVLPALAEEAGWPETLAGAASVARERGEEYGPPGENMDAVARLWTAYLRNKGAGASVTLSAADAALMMNQLKVARDQTGESSLENFVDMAGYARVAAAAEGVEGGDG